MVTIIKSTLKVVFLVVYATTKKRDKGERGLRDSLRENGREVSEVKAIGVEFIDYFKRLLGDDDLPTETIDEE
ncbi:hypothetical protein Dimus_025196, partial [Dionaea muscipula]